MFRDHHMLLMVRVQKYFLPIYSQINIPNTVMELDTSIAIAHTVAILIVVRRFVEVCRDPNGLRMPIYRPKLIKHMCSMLDEQASTSHVT